MRAIAKSTLMKFWSQPERANSKGALQSGYAGRSKQAKLSDAYIHYRWTVSKLRGIASCDVIGRPYRIAGFPAFKLSKQHRMDNVSHR